MAIAAKEAIGGEELDAASDGSYFLQQPRAAEGRAPDKDLRVYATPTRRYFTSK